MSRQIRNQIFFLIFILAIMPLLNIPDLAYAFILPHGLPIEAGFGSGIMVRPIFGFVNISSQNINPTISRQYQKSYGGGGTFAVRFCRNASIKLDFWGSGYNREDKKERGPYKILQKEHYFNDGNIEIVGFNDKPFYNFLNIGASFGMRRIKENAQFVIKDTLTNIEYTLVSIDEKVSSVYFGVNSSFTIPTPWRKEMIILNYNYILGNYNRYIITTAYKLITPHKRYLSDSSGEIGTTSYLLFRYYRLNAK
ncbi:MAG: hypothetical protein AB1393_12225 [Candidatus Edwardsbacteria bacterium]